MWYSLRWQLTIQLLFAAGLGATSVPDRLARGNVQFNHGFYRSAIADYEGALILAESPAAHADILYRLALAHGKLAELSAAEQYYKEAIGVWRADGSDPRLALAFSGLGEIYRLESRLDDALATEQHALRILKHAGMGETQQAASVLSITGGILHDRHRFKIAEKDLREALTILERTVGPDHPDFALSLNNLGVVESAQNHIAEAEALLKRALSIREARLGPAHPLIASTLLSLSWVYLEQKRYAEAEQTCRRALQMMTRFFPENHPDPIKAHILLAQTAGRSGNFPAAVSILEEVIRSVDAGSSAVSLEHVQVLELYSRYLSDAGEKEKSRQFRNEARQLLKRYSDASAARSTVTLAELEAASLH